MKASKMMLKMAGVLGVLFLVAGCSKTNYIAGTRIPATQANREIIEVMENYRRAMIAIDADAMVKLAHPEYRQPKTTADENSYDYKGLVKAIRMRFAQTKSVRLDIQYRKIHWESPERVSVEVYLDGSYQVIVGEENRWEKKTDYMKLILEKHKDAWLFIEGL